MIIRRARAAGIAVLVSLALAACVNEPSPGGPSAIGPALSFAPSIAAAASVEPTRTPVPPTPAPTVAPTTSPRPTSRPTPPRPSASPYDPALEAMLPRTVRGIELLRVSTPMATFAGGSDMCIILCADEPGRLAKATDVPIDRMALAVGIPPDDSGLAAGVIAMRFTGVDDRSLVEARLTAGSHSTPTIGLPGQAVRLRVGGKDVVWATWPPFYEERQGEYLLEHEDVLFIVQGLPPSAAGVVPDDVALMIEALP